MPPPRLVEEYISLAASSPPALLNQFAPDPVAILTESYWATGSVLKTSRFLSLVWIGGACICAEGRGAWVGNGGSCGRGIWGNGLESGPVGAMAAIGVVRSFSRRFLWSLSLCRSLSCIRFRSPSSSCSRSRSRLRFLLQQQQKTVMTTTATIRKTETIRAVTHKITKKTIKTKKMFKRRIAIVKVSNKEKIQNIKGLSSKLPRFKSVL